MKKLTRQDLYPLEVYAEKRAEIRREVIAHKRRRQIHLGDHICLLFEDRLTIQYQVQEMLRIERIFEPAAIQEELGAYNPLIPEGSDWRATMQIEYADVDERHVALRQLKGVEDCVWVRVGNGERIYAIADEDLERTNEIKTAAVHFLRFPLGIAEVAMLRDGAALTIGVDHPACTAEVAVEGEQREALIRDLD
jgi:hypothetical protein